MPSFIELKECLSQCGISQSTLAELLQRSANWPATTEHYTRFVTSVFEQQPEPEHIALDGDQLVHMHRSWRPKPATAKIIKQYLGVSEGEFARIRFNWVLKKQEQALLNPDFHFLYDVQSGQTSTDPLDNAMHFAHTSQQVDAAWHETVEIQLEEPDWPDDPPPVVDVLTARFSVNVRTFNLRSYQPHVKTVKWLIHKHHVPKTFIFDKPRILDSFVGHINQQWLPLERNPNERWRFVEEQFCQWVLERFPKFCALDDNAAFDYALARYVKKVKLSDDALREGLADILAPAHSLRDAANLLMERIYETGTK